MNVINQKNSSLIQNPVQMNSVIVPASVTVTAKVQSKTFRCKVMLILSWVSDWQADCIPFRPALPRTLVVF